MVNEKFFLVTPLEKEAMSNLKGGAMAERSPCRGHWSCAGGIKNHTLYGYELQKNGGVATQK